jgi:hypothetical protein
MICAGTNNTLAGAEAVIFLVAAQIKKYDEYSYSKVAKYKHVPIFWRILPLKKALCRGLQHPLFRPAPQMPSACCSRRG